MSESKPPYPYMNATGTYVDPTSKYYVDRVWEEYHKIKNELEETKSKLAHSDAVIASLKTLVKLLHNEEEKLIQTINELKNTSKE